MRRLPGLEDNLDRLSVCRLVDGGRVVDVLLASAAEADGHADVGWKITLGRLAPNPHPRPPGQRQIPAPPPFGPLLSPVCPSRIRLPASRTPLGICQHLLL